MRGKAHEYLNTEEGKGLEEFLRNDGFLKDEVPRIPPSVTYAELRRTAARLRSGKIRGNPRMPPNELADLIEKSIRQDQIVRGVFKADREQTAFERECELKDEATFVAGFHHLKKIPEAADPESPVAEQVRQIHRELKKKMGRGRKRKR
ncbi:MAG TPA: hypothetical protein VLC46_06655 [Thermoanaerobaculia bacterium]|nr:hypothetical protein [Thermoanaerobaculia bacterium]